jgi:hypothetical protein
MPQFYKVSDPDYFDAMTHPAMRFLGEAAREHMPGWDLSYIVMGDDASDPNVPVAGMLQIAPGETLPKHAHDSFRVEVMVRGSIQLPNGDVLYPGDVMVSRPGEFYGPHVAGPEGSLSVEIFAFARGAFPVYDPTDGANAFTGTGSEQANAVISRFKAETPTGLPG